MGKVNTVSISIVSFFTFMMFWTLNGDSGRDMNDVLVDYWESRLVTKEVTP